MTPQRRAVAEPRTLYKPRDIENALRNMSHYGWAREIVDGWKGGAAFALRQDRAFFDALIPDLTPGSFYGQNCPTCVGKQSVMGESDVFDWSVESPNRLTCNRCGTVYPNARFPETGVLKCPRMGQTFSYYETDLERADPVNRNRHALKWLSDRPTMTSFSAMIRFAKVRWAFGQVLPLAKLYALTGDVACAERAAWILDRVARVYPGYLYHHNFDNVHEVADTLYGYSDPPGYQPKEGPRLDNLNPFASGRFHLALLSLLRSLAPGRRLPVIGDTFYDTEIGLLYAEVLAARLGGRYASLLETIQGASLSERGTEYALWYRPHDLRAGGTADLPLRSEWFPGWHVGVLRGGKAEETAFFLNGNENRWTLGDTGHRHRDVLSLSAYAFGQEMVSDRGYFSGSGQLTRDGRNGQRWATSTLSHNLVVVDSENQSDRDCGTNLELFGVAPGIEIVQASGVNVYPQCGTYRRTMALVRTPDGGAYAVDFFRVKGGKTHHYSFVCEGTLTPAHAKAEPVDLPPAWSAWLSHPRAFRPASSSTFTWRSGEVSLDLMLLNTGDTVDRVIVADAPGWRRGSPASELEKPPLGQILVENRARNPGEDAATQYAALIVPYRSSRSPVLGARLLVNDLRSGVVAVEVKLAGRTDYVISTPDQVDRPYGPITAAGELAFVSVDDKGRATQGYLLNGTRLACGDLRASLPAPHLTLKVRSVE